MAQANLDKLVKALDKVEAQLSKIEGMMGSSGSTGAGAGAGGASVDAFDALVAQFIPKLVSDGKTIAADVGEHVRGESFHFGFWPVRLCSPTIAHSALSFCATTSPLCVSSKSCRRCAIIARIGGDLWSSLKRKTKISR